MKTLTLNKKQCEKLLKLCKEFFPEYQVELLEMSDDFLDSEYYIECRKMKNDIKTGFLIHWYQLCLTKLSEKIWNKLKTDKIEGDYALNNFLCFNEEYPQDTKISYYENLVGLRSYLTEYHPVEFLWSFVEFSKKHQNFKKIK